MPFPDTTSALPPRSHSIEFVPNSNIAFAPADWLIFGAVKLFTRYEGVEDWLNAYAPGWSWVIVYAHKALIPIEVSFRFVREEDALAFSFKFP